MATARFNIDDLRRLGLKADITKGIVEDIGMEVEKVEGKEAVIDITPNRPDMLGIVGFARSLSFFAGEQTPRENQYKVAGEPMVEITVSSNLKDARPYIAAMIVHDVDLSNGMLRYLIDFTEKLADTNGRKRKKIAIGLHDFQRMSQPVSYEAVRDGKMAPLGSRGEQSLRKVIESTGQGKEYGAIIEEGPYPVVSDADGIISLVPVINSERTKVTEGTKEIFVEVTGTSKLAVNDMLDLLACRFIDAGGKVYQCTIVYGKRAEATPQLSYREMKVKDLEIERALGALLDPNKLVTMANRMGYVAAKYGKETMFFVPPYRLDVLNEQDVIDDMAVAYGYERITPIPIMGSAVGIEDEFAARANRIARAMMGLGFSEAINNYLTNEWLNFKSLEGKEGKSVKVAESKTETITMLRTTLLPGLLQNLAASSHDTMPQMLFETGPVFDLEGGKAREYKRMAMVSEHARANFSEIKAAVLAVLRSMGVERIALKEKEDSAFIKGRCAAVMVDKKEIGKFGEIHPQVLQNFKIEEPVVAAEINLD